MTLQATTKAGMEFLGWFSVSLVAYYFFIAIFSSRIVVSLISAFLIAITRIASKDF